VSELLVVDFSNLGLNLPNLHKVTGVIKLHTAETHLITGPNGVGKSTFLDLFEAILTDRKLSYSRAFQAELNCLDANLIVKDLLDDVGYFYPKNDHVFLLFSALNIDEILPLTIARLSGGEKQRLKIYLTLLPIRHIYLLDEPFNHLDERYIQCLLNILNEMKMKSSATFLISDHQAKIVTKWSYQFMRNEDKVNIIEQGS